MLRPPLAETTQFEALPRPPPRRHASESGRRRGACIAVPLRASLLRVQSGHRVCDCREYTRADMAQETEFGFSGGVSEESDDEPQQQQEPLVGGASGLSARDTPTLHLRSDAIGEIVLFDRASSRLPLRSVLSRRRDALCERAWHPSLREPSARAHCSECCAVCS